MFNKEWINTLNHNLVEGVAFKTQACLRKDHAADNLINIISILKSQILNLKSKYKASPLARRGLNQTLTRLNQNLIFIQGHFA
jgi:hypothetical protein